MPSNRFSAAVTALPAETLAELHDGLALALDALDGRRISTQRVADAKAHLRWAIRRAERLLDRRAAG